MKLAAVAMSGIIGFVGLVVPHAVRILWGHMHQTLLPSAFVLGGVLLVVAVINLHHFIVDGYIWRSSKKVSTQLAAPAPARA